MLSMRHSSHKGHDDCLHEGERIHFVLTGLFLLGRISFGRSCPFESELDVESTALPGAKTGDWHEAPVASEARHAGSGQYVTPR